MPFREGRNHFPQSHLWWEVELYLLFAAQMKHHNSSINCASTFPACLFINFFLSFFLCCSREPALQGGFAGESLELQAQDVPGVSPGCGTRGAVAAQWMSLVVCSEEGKPDLCLQVRWRGDFGAGGHSELCSRCAFIPPARTCGSRPGTEGTDGTVLDPRQHRWLHLSSQPSPFPQWTLQLCPLSFSSGWAGPVGCGPCAASAHPAPPAPCPGVSVPPAQPRASPECPGPTTASSGAASNLHPPLASRGCCFRNVLLIPFSPALPNLPSTFSFSLCFFIIW